MAIEPPSSREPAISWAGDRFLRVSLSDTPTAEAGERVRAACEALRAAAIPGLVDLTPAYTTVLITFDALALGSDGSNAERDVRGALKGLAAVSEAVSARLVEIPVCYDTSHGEDLEDLAAAHGLTPAEVATLHSSAEYRVAFIGFTPGFPYLRGLPERLSTPRLPSPRPRVTAGSIGIAGTQTGIYPGGTPGGWRLIGRTPLRIFDADRHEPALLAMGDRVRFIPITTSEFDTLSAATPKEGR